MLYLFYHNVASFIQYNRYILIYNNLVLLAFFVSYLVCCLVLYAPLDYCHGLISRYLMYQLSSSADFSRKIFSKNCLSSSIQIYIGADGSNRIQFAYRLLNIQNQKTLIHRSFLSYYVNLHLMANNAW